MRTFPPIRDLVTDARWNYQAAKPVPPFKLAHPEPFTLHQRDVHRIQAFRRGSWSMFRRHRVVQPDSLCAEVINITGDAHSH